MGITECGIVQVLYGGSPDGLSDSDHDLWYQGYAGLADTPEPADRFGSVLASGDFNGDGFDDLAVGVPFENEGGDFNTGVVQVLYGSADGLTSIGNKLWKQGEDDLQGTPEAMDYFGDALTTGDFNGDGFDDLAIGAPFEDIASKLGGDILDVGVTQVIYGSESGLTSENNDYWHQNMAYVEDAAEEGDHFGRALAAGDFNNDGIDDLAIGVPEEDIEDISDAGAVNILYGAGTGLTASGNQLWHQDVGDVGSDCELNDHFGAALAVGNFNDDFFSDLAIGVPDEDIAQKLGGDITDAGMVNVLYGSANGITDAGDQPWHQNMTNVDDTAEESDHFGFALATGDFDANGFDDLAIGVPYEDLERDPLLQDSGGVAVIYGTQSGLSATTIDDQYWTQASNFMNSGIEANDLFGYSLAALPRQVLRMYLPMVVK